MGWRWGLVVMALIALATAGCSAMRSAGQASVPTGGQSTSTGGQDAQAPTVLPEQDVVSASKYLDPSGKFFGLEAQGAPDSMGPVQTAAAEVGKNPNLIGEYVAWNSPFDTGAASSALSYGAMYYVVWEPYGPSVADIADGKSDAYITRFAEAVRDFGKPVAISFGHEFNGDWYPWGTTGTTPSEFVAAWQHIHDLFAAAGAKNAIWIWNPNCIDAAPDVQLEQYWPGSAYVQWVGVTGYFATTGPDTFEGIYGPTMSEIREFTSKPFIIAETAVESGPDETESVDSLFNGVESDSDVLGLIWFDYNKNGVDWTFDDRADIRAAVASALSGMQLVSVAR
jgi:mannan endo-1,4-beta-mannosidase